MPAISSHGALELERREWRQTVGQSGMTPTAFAFLIPVFVVVVFCPFLCVFCIRKRQNAVPPVKPVKKPALRRAEARERLKQVTDVSDVTNGYEAPHRDAAVEGEPTELAAQSDTAGDQTQQVAESSSITERECAICLSALYAPSPPEPALLSSQPTVDEAAMRPSTPSPANPTPTEPEAILKLRACGHEFHAECLVSWFVLRKTSCPICRASYISKEDMQAYEDEEAAIGATAEAANTPAPEVSAGTGANGARISNWRYFWRGENVWNRSRQGRASDGERNGEGQQGQSEAQELARWAYFRHGRR